MEQTLSTGLTDLGTLKNINGQEHTVTRTPLVQEGRVVGAIGKVVSRGLEHLRDIFLRLDTAEKQLSYYKSELSKLDNAHLRVADIVSISPSMEKLKQEVKRVAKSLSPILLLGETGTGKELFARAVHNDSGRKGPFITVNCAAIPAELLESEFFGYAEGAFTGAKKGGKPGKFELADGGTLF